MTVLLVELDREKPQPPLSLAYMAAVLRQNDIPVEIYDLYFESHRENYIKALKEEPELVGFTSNSFNYPISIGLCNYVKKKSPSTKTIIGGPGVNTLGEPILSDFPYVDYICYGEGEYTVLELVKHLQEDGPIENAPNLVFRDDGKIKSTKFELIEDLDSLPFPARDLFPKSSDYKGDIESIIASRGCPYSCKFCEYSESYKGQYHRRSMENIFKEIEIEMENGIKRFMIEDQLFPVHAKEFNEHKGNKEFKYDILARLNLIVKYEKDLEECIKNGLFSLEAGLESPSLNPVFNKGFDKDTIKKAFKILRKWDKKKYKITYDLYGIAFSKEQTLESYKSDIKFLRDNLHGMMGLDYIGSSFNLISNRILLKYGSRLYEEYKKEGLIGNASFDKKDLESLFGKKIRSSRIISEDGPIEPEAMYDVIYKINGKWDIYDPHWMKDAKLWKIQCLIDEFKGMYSKGLLKLEKELIETGLKLPEGEGTLSELGRSVWDVWTIPLDFAWGLVNKKSRYNLGHILNVFKKARERINLAKKIIELNSA